VFGVHWVWLAMLFLVMVGVVALIFGFVAYTSRSRLPVPSPVISPDGRMWWDGHEWKPMPEPGPPTPP
jgi:hypothetical protein